MLTTALTANKSPIIHVITKQRSIVSHPFLTRLHFYSQFLLSRVNVIPSGCVTTPIPPQKRLFVSKPPGSLTQEMPLCGGDRMACDSRKMSYEALDNTRNARLYL